MYTKKGRSCWRNAVSSFGRVFHDPEVLHDLLKGQPVLWFLLEQLGDEITSPWKNEHTIELKIILRLLGPLVEKTDPTNFRRESDDNFVGTKRWGWTDIHTASLERAKIFSRGKPDVKNISD